jgi:hypothetical protein
LHRPAKIHHIETSVRVFISLLDAVGDGSGEFVFIVVSEGCQG